MDNFSRRGTAGTGGAGILALKLTQDAANFLLTAL